MRNGIAATAVSVVILGLSMSAGAADPKGEFVGSLKCKKCHLEEYKSWKDTWHSKIARPKKARFLRKRLKAGPAMAPIPVPRQATSPEKPSASTMSSL